MTVGATEESQGVHPFTVGWWRSLPTTYRRADRSQGYRLSEAWHGLNRDPRFITGWDGWYRANTSQKPWQSAVSFTRSFRTTPNVPVYIRSWHRPAVINSAGERIPVAGAARVRHVIRNYTGDIVVQNSSSTGGDTGGATTTVDAGQVLVGDENIYEGGGVLNPPAEEATAAPVAAGDTINHYTRMTPDKFGVIQVTVHVEIDYPNARDLMEAIHIGKTDTTFDLLPDADYFATAAAYPLLRYLDGIGHQAGFLSDTANDMHNGAWTNPLTAPESYLPFLASVLGLPRHYSDRLTRPQLRQHLVDMVNGNSPTPGSRDHIAITAKQWLIGNKDVSVMPAHATPGYTGADPVHTIIVTAKATEVPKNDLVAFENFLNNAGVVPAGHRVIVREASGTWDQFQTFAGITWDEKASKIRTWNEGDSAGVTLT